MDHSEHILGLQQALADPGLTDTERAEIEDHLQHLIEAQHVEQSYQRAKQWAADRDGQVVLAAQGYHVLVGHVPESLAEYRPSPPGHFNQVAIGGPDVTPPSGRGPHPNQYEVTFQETKGGEEYVFDAYEGAKQGSFPYLKSILLSGRDPRLATAFAALRDSGEHPGFVQALRHGAVRIRYQFVQALPSGTVHTDEFQVNKNARLRWNGEAVELLMWD